MKGKRNKNRKDMQTESKVEMKFTFYSQNKIFDRN